MTKISQSPFKRLLGVWKTSGRILSDDAGQNLTGTDSYELILDGNFILHRADVLMGTTRSETFEIIGLEQSSEKAEMRYFNASGESGTMTGQIKGNDFLIDGGELKFAGKIDDQNTLIVGKWFRHSEDGGWGEFIDLRLEKQK